MQLHELFERAKEVTGSHAETARRLGVKPQKVNEWKHNHVPCPLTMQAQVCGLAGMDEIQTRDYVWGVIRERLGKARSAVAFGGAVLIAFMGSVFAPPAESRGVDDARAYV